MSALLKRKTAGEKAKAIQGGLKRQKVTEEERVARAIEQEDGNEGEEGEQEDHDEDDFSVSEDDDGSDLESEAEESRSDETFESTEDPTTPSKKLKKRNDPSVFATSISKILASKPPKDSLSNSTISNPVASSDAIILSRSADAIAAAKALSTSRLEEAARRKLRHEKRARLDRGRITDVLGLQTPEVSTADIIEREKKYKKIAQRGAVMLFNAIRAAQKEAKKAIEESQEAKGGDLSMIGRDAVDEKVTEMSKNGFLELIAGGGKK